MVMRKFVSLILAAVMLSAIATSCAEQPQQEPSPEVVSEETVPEETVNIDLWTQPYFAAGADGQSFDTELVAAFNETHPGIAVTLHQATLDAQGKEQLDTAVDEGTVDLLYDSADKLIGYARVGKLRDLSALFTDEVKQDLPETIVSACGLDGMQYLYPISTSPYLMAFNKELLENAGLLELLPWERGENRAWTVAEYTALLTAMHEKLPEEVKPGVVYAMSSSGDGATRALMTNLYGAQFVDEKRGEYLIGSDEGKKAFAWLNETVQAGLLEMDEEKSSADVVKDFVDGKTAHTILYTVGLANNYADSKKGGFTEILMPYPTQDGQEGVLEYNLFGLAVVDNGDEKRAEAAQTFIDFAANDRQYSRMAAVLSGGISPCLSKNELRYDPEYIFAESLKPYFGRYVPATEGFDMMKTYWFTALADAAAKDAKTETVLDSFVKAANQTIGDAATEREEAQKAQEDAAAEAQE